MNNDFNHWNKKQTRCSDHCFTELDGLLLQLIKCRNSLCHSPDCLLSTDDFEKYLQLMIDLFNKLKLDHDASYAERESIRLGAIKLQRVCHSVCRN